MFVLCCEELKLNGEFRLAYAIIWLFPLKEADSALLVGVQ